MADPRDMIATRRWPRANGGVVDVVAASLVCARTRAPITFPMSIPTLSVKLAALAAGAEAAGTAVPSVETGGTDLLKR